MRPLLCLKQSPLWPAPPNPKLQEWKRWVWGRGLRLHSWKWPCVGNPESEGSWRGRGGMSALVPRAVGRSCHLWGLLWEAERPRQGHRSHPRGGALSSPFGRTRRTPRHSRLIERVEQVPVTWKCAWGSPEMPGPADGKLGHPCKQELRYQTVWPRSWPGGFCLSAESKEEGRWANG